MPLSSNFLESTCKNYDNWQIFTEDMDKVQYATFLAHSLCLEYN